MPSITVDQGDITVAQAAQALSEKLGSRYTVTPHGGGRHESVKVAASAMSYANVHLDHGAGNTRFHVHGGGIVLGRIANELFIARTVSSAIRDVPSIAWKKEV